MNLTQSCLKSRGWLFLVFGLQLALSLFSSFWAEQWKLLFTEDNSKSSVMSTGYLNIQEIAISYSSIACYIKRCLTPIKTLIWSASWDLPYTTIFSSAYKEGTDDSILTSLTSCCNISSLNTFFKFMNSPYFYCTWIDKITRQGKLPLTHGVTLQLGDKEICTSTLLEGYPQSRGQIDICSHLIGFPKCNLLSQSFILLDLLRITFLFLENSIYQVDRRPLLLLLQLPDL